MSNIEIRRTKKENNNRCPRCNSSMLMGTKGDFGGDPQARLKIKMMCPKCGFSEIKKPKSK